MCEILTLYGLSVYSIINGFTYRGENHTASWRHIRILFEFDKKNEVNGLRSLPSLRDEHIYPEKIQKMKVKLAAQVFNSELQQY